MLRHKHEAGETFSGFPEMLLIKFQDEYYVANYVRHCGKYKQGGIYKCVGGIWFTVLDNFEWYDLKELEE